MKSSRDARDEEKRRRRRVSDPERARARCFNLRPRPQVGLIWEGNRQGQRSCSGMMARASYLARVRTGPFSGIHVYAATWEETREYWNPSQYGSRFLYASASMRYGNCDFRWMGYDEVLGWEIMAIGRCLGFENGVLEF